MLRSSESQIGPHECLVDWLGGREATMIAEQAHQAIFPMESDENALQLLLLGDCDHEIEEMCSKGMPLPVIHHQEGNLGHHRICLPIKACDADQFGFPVRETAFCDQDDVVIQIRMANTLEASMVDARVQRGIRKVAESNRLVREVLMQDHHMRLIVGTNRTHGYDGSIIERYRCR
jgi:hypothetical protein